jgi:saccharopine dehydrogenase-like NADP-dependent oxidoreductase
MKKKKYDFLILGAGGMQGKIVLKDLLEKDYKVFISDFYQHHIDTLKEKFPNIDYELADLRDTKQINALINRVKPFLVINCAEGDWNLGQTYQ